MVYGACNYNIPGGYKPTSITRGARIATTCINRHWVEEGWLLDGLCQLVFELALLRCGQQQVGRHRSQGVLHAVPCGRRVWIYGGGYRFLGYEIVVVL